MFFKKKDTKVEPQYKAIYKSLYSGNTKEILIINEYDAFTSYIQDGEVWYLTHIKPLEENTNEN